MGESVISENNRTGERLKIFNNFVLIGQFGLSLIMPVIICVVLCYMLVSHGFAGAWVYIPGFIMGLGASFMTAYKFYLFVLKKEEKKSSRVNRKGVYFNHHI